jgi:flagellar basal-body rod protein FlgB
MFIDRLFKQDSTPVLEQLLQFTTARSQVLAEDVVNIDTPGYKSKDLNLAAFQKLLAERIDNSRSQPPGSENYSDMQFDLQSPAGGILFHDGSNKSMEQLESDQAKNALMHNLAIELLRKQFATMQMALRERVS